MRRHGLIYRIECVIGNRSFSRGKFHAELTWQSIGFGWQGSFAVWACRDFPGITVNLIHGDEWHSVSGFQRQAV